jgi:hypothetical protein
MLAVVKQAAEVVESASKLGEGWTAVFQLTIGQVVQPLGFLLIAVAIWWWLSRRQIADQTEIAEAVAHLRSEATRQAENFSTRQAQAMDVERSLKQLQEALAALPDTVQSAISEARANDKKAPDEGAIAIAALRQPHALSKMLQMAETPLMGIFLPTGPLPEAERKALDLAVQLGVAKVDVRDGEVQAWSWVAPNAQPVDAVALAMER